MPKCINCGEIISEIQFDIFKGNCPKCVRKIAQQQVGNKEKVGDEWIGLGCLVIIMGCIIIPLILIINQGYEPGLKCFAIGAILGILLILCGLFINRGSKKQ